MLALSRSAGVEPPARGGARGYVESWLPRADDALLRNVPPEGATGGENVGTALLRAILHTWFHAGEINAVRQMLGHPEIPFVGKMVGVMEWGARSG